jgi:hypothetical protein
MVFFNFLATTKTANKTKKLPKQEAIIIPNGDNKMEVAKPGKKLAPKTTKATPKLEPELKPKT